MASSCSFHSDGATMECRCRSSSSTVSTGSRRCGCGDKLIFLTSNSEANPGRRFWRCPNWNTPNSCNFFNWADKKNILEVATTSDEVAQSLFASDLLQEESTRKILKLKKKLAAERRKSWWLVVAIVVSLATFFAVLLCISGRGYVG